MLADGSSRAPVIAGKANGGSGCVWRCLSPALTIPIGAVLTPPLAGLERAQTLPYASSLCGACYEVCPVKINIPEVLVYLRGQIVARQERHLSGKLNTEQVAMRWLARRALGPLTHNGVITWLPGMLKGWTATRDLRALPKQTFREWWQQRGRSR